MFEKVNQYFLSHLGDLPLEKRFHYLSRLYLWEGRPAQQVSHLESYKNDIVGDGSAEAMRRVIENALNQGKAAFGSNHAIEERAPFFEKYPLLQPANTALFRLINAFNMYDVDHRELLFELFDKKDLDALYENLLADTAALLVLSTHAANFLYLYRCFVQEKDSSGIIKTLMSIDPPTDDASPTQQLMYCYLITHAIIGETIFYQQPIRKQLLGSYRSLLSRVETLIGNAFENINLDAKCEFLVCCRLLGYDSSLRKKIFDEAEQSLSRDGDFIIDTHNSYSQKNLVSFDQSEHRNILYVLCNLPTPLSSV